MEKNGQAFLKRLLLTFKEEAVERLHTLSSDLIELERAATPEERAALIESIFREAHSLKGSSRAVNLADIERLCQEAESLLSALKRQAIEPSPQVLDLLHEMVDCLEKRLTTLDGAPAEAAMAAASALCRRLAEAARGAPPPLPTTAEPGRGEPEPTPAKTMPTERPPVADTVRIEVSRLDAALSQAESLLTAKLAARQLAFELREARASFVRFKQEGAGETAFFKAHDARLGALVKSAERGWRSLGGLVDGLLDDVKRLSMLPLAAVLEVLPKVARDISRQQGKEVDFLSLGGDIEIDRRILDELRDPLIHLVRNSVDHGIEGPEMRLAAGKPRRGRISVKVSPMEGRRIEISLADDGAGIDLARLQAVAHQLGYVPASEGANLPAEQLLPLLFQSGVSTSERITDISGRGLGLAIVREKVERLGGTVGIESRPGAGTLFRLVLPLTLATFRGVHVRAGGQDFIFPTPGLDQVARLRRHEVQRVGHRETVCLAGQVVALARLSDLLSLESEKRRESTWLALVVASAEDGIRIAFEVDAVVEELEVLMKNLGRQLARVRHIGGAAVLGDGQVVPVLYVPDLLRAARRGGALEDKAFSAQDHHAPHEPPAAPWRLP